MNIGQIADMGDCGRIVSSSAITPTTAMITQAITTIIARMFVVTPAIVIPVPWPCLLNLIRLTDDRGSPTTAHGLATNAPNIGIKANYFRGDDGVKALKPRLEVYCISNHLKGCSPN